MTTPLTYGDESDQELVGEVQQGASAFIELGSTGLKRSAGYVDEEFLPQLRGRKSIQVYREMGENDPIVGAMLFAMVQLCRNVDFSVTPAGKSKEHADHAKFVEQCMDDMTHPWGDFVAEAIQGKLQYGWSWHEVVLKRRVSPWAKDGRQRSKHSDNMVGWRRMPVRAQDTLHRWVFGPDGEVVGMIQLAAPDYKQRVLPIERSVLFRHGVYKGNPEGRSALRNAYRPWFYKKRLEEFESVGVERDLAGLPMVTVPSDYLRASKGTEQAKMVDAMKRMVRAIRRNEQEGLVFPAAYDSETKNPLFKFELLGSGGARQFSTNELITRYEQRILMTMLADFIMVGSTATGTYNMHVDKTKIFRAALNQVVQSFCDDLNRHVIPKLFMANGLRVEELPRITPSDVDAPDLTQLGGFLAQTAGLGFSWGPDADMEKFLRNAAGLPELGDDDYSKRRKLARKTEATMMLETQTAYLAARSALVQAEVQEELTAQGANPEDVMMTQQNDQQDQEQAQAQQQQGVDQQMAGEKHQMDLKQQEFDMKMAAKEPKKPNTGKPGGTTSKGKKQR
ncbi:MAG: hypothetical protein ABIO67_06595 [Mycobacteriales bacterium]